MLHSSQRIASSCHPPRVQPFIQLSHAALRGKCQKPCSKQARLVSTRGLLDSILGGFSAKTHAPDLVPIDMDSEGGLGGTSAELFGPLAVVLLGYHPGELEAFRSFMIEMEADMVKIISCNGRLTDQTLQQVVEAPPPEISQPAIGARRAVFLSGMSGAEVSEVIGAYNDSGLPETVWAAAVPMNYSRKISSLIDDIYGDHVYLRSNPDAVPG